MTNDTHAHITGLWETNCSCLARIRILRITVCVCVCVCVCLHVSYPPRSRRSRSAMSFGLAVGGWLTFEPPSLHYTLKTLSNAAHKHKKIHECTLVFLDLHTRYPRGYKKRGLSLLPKSVTDLSEVMREERNTRGDGNLNLRFSRDVHILARTVMCCIQRSAWKHRKTTGPYRDL